MKNNDIEKMSNDELSIAKQKLEYEISKYHNYQLAKKVQLNSAYGAMGNEYFRFYDIRLAAAVTISGRIVIQWIANDMNKYLNSVLKTDNVDYIIGIDTDSMYITLDEMIIKYNLADEDAHKVIEFLDRVCKTRLQKMIDESFERLGTYMNVYKQKMVMKREALSDKAIWTTKKRYAMSLYDLEGVRYEKPILKIMGLEAVKSSTPLMCRDKMKEAIELMMWSDNDAVIKLIEDFREEFKNSSAEDIGSPISCNNLEKYSDSRTLYRSGTPYQVRGALVFNQLLKKHELERQYDTIKDGDKVKTIALVEPNPTHENVISFSTVLPKEFGLHKYIDFDAQYDKVYLKPIQAILDAINWKSEHISTLEDLWS